MNLNDLAKEIAKREGGKVQVNIAQIKEIISVLGEILEEYGVVECLEILETLQKVGKRRLSEKGTVTIIRRK